jgi:hypothetical protein
MEKVRNNKSHYEFSKGVSLSFAYFSSHTNQIQNSKHQIHQSNQIQSNFMENGRKY